MINNSLNSDLKKTLKFWSNKLLIRLRETHIILIDKFIVIYTAEVEQLTFFREKNSQLFKNLF